MCDSSDGDYGDLSILKMHYGRRSLALCKTLLEFGYVVCRVLKICEFSVLRVG